MGKLASDGTVRLGGGKPVLIAGKVVVRIRRRGAVLPAFPRRNTIILANGNRVPFDLQPMRWAEVGGPLRLEDGRLRLHAPSTWRGAAGTELRLPRSFVTTLWLAAPEGEDPDLMTFRLLNGRRSRDVLYLKNGDRLEGNVLGLESGQECTLETGERKVNVEFARIACLAFNTDLQAQARPALPYFHVVLKDGSRVDFSLFQIEPGASHGKGKTVFGARVEVPVAEIAAVDLRQANVVYLSDLKPKSYEHTPFLGLSWPLAKDTSVSGGPLRLAGNTYDKGLGMHSQSRVSFALDGQFRWFEALVGLDELTGQQGRARIRVLLDGKDQNLARDKELTGKDPPVAVRLDVRKARALTLETLFGSFGDVQARMNWADARLLR